MYLFNDLKPKIRITENEIECPIKGCLTSVKKQKKYFRKDKEFYCPNHKIFISTSTFEYESENDNLLWNNKDDLKLLNEIKSTKRECRLGRERSEDALTWNVFRYLEKTNQLQDLLSPIHKNPINNVELIYWSYSRKNKGIFSDLKNARVEFGEKINQGSEPDLIVCSDEAIFFIEAKLLALNNTKPSNPSEEKKYKTGGNNWFNEVFKTEYDSIVHKEFKYELMRFWLLGSWIAKSTNKSFYLISLLPKFRDIDIEESFGKHLNQTINRKFLRIDWEQIYTWVDLKFRTDEEKLLCDYLRNKSIGYDAHGNLQNRFLFNNTLSDKIIIGSDWTKEEKEEWSKGIEALDGLFRK
ncbi:hypothetical protein [Flavobacterium filum]|mgnify:CR=1 FL=1|uniref:hypothetical protein n=1 Tax=Flavobacterium filum TaxID=370974 RepID=UPI0023F4E9AB|nr:hypothetical protein [Flavobacterium filum]